ncbi:MAG: Fe-S cluster assembly ATPase SufC [Candidatus Moranbacteria bacterium]|nr:Fe-S cluster assembly ATPase SufC [Candidatus Moranbacteria bacterium]
MLSIKNLSVSIERKKILQDISFDFKPGKTYAILGPNGSGKSTLASTLLGHPNFLLSRNAKITFQRKNIQSLSPNKRATLGLFLSFQTPLALPGVTIFDLLRLALEKKIDPVTLHKKIQEYAKELDIKEELLRRSLNDGFSGGEKKKMEALQAVLLAPQFALFDEVDTGVDVDALKKITQFLKKHLPKKTTRVFITHSAKLLQYVKPDHVLVMKEGRLVKTGSVILAKKIERFGFDVIPI